MRTLLDRLRHACSSSASTCRRAPSTPTSSPVAAKHGESLAIFPEGTLLRRPGLLPFRTGAFQVAAQAGIPVVPMALRGVRSVLRDGTWFPRRYPIAVTIGAPIAPGRQRLECRGASCATACAPRC